MNVVRRSKATLIQNQPIIAREYTTECNTMNLALIQLDGRYPKAGYTLNQEAEALVQIVRGSGALHLKNGSSTALSQGDQVYLAKNEAYSFEGKLELLYAATPKWTPEQTKHITE